MSKLHRLRDDLRFVPTVNSWYATPMLVSPLTFALTTQRSHIPQLRSFLEAPALHRSSARNPEMRGGPFISHDGDPKEIEDFLGRTQVLCAQSLRLAQAFIDLHKSVMAQATGDGLRGLHGCIHDDVLADAIEISYDLAKLPGIRIIEPALYRSIAYDEALQGCKVEFVTKRERPFILSSPLLHAGRPDLEIRAPLRSRLWDTLFASGSARPREWFADLLRPHVNPALWHSSDPLADLLTDEPAAPRRWSPPQAGTVRVRYFGHACVLLESEGTSVLVDPLVGYDGEAEAGQFTFADLPERIDHVLITHPHPDHLVLETLLRLRGRIGQVIVGRASGGNPQDVSPRLMLEQCGFQHVREIGEYEEIDIGSGHILGAPFYGEHSDLDIRSKILFGVVLEGRACAFFADSNPPQARCYRLLREMLPRLDCLFLGMECVGAPATWVYGPLLLNPLNRREDQSRRLDGSNARTALDVLEYFDPEHLFIYAMGAEPWVSHISSIVYADDLPQFLEARKVERAARERGKDAQLLFGRMELVIGN